MFQSSHKRNLEAVAQYGLVRFRFVIFWKLTDDRPARIADVGRADAECPDRSLRVHVPLPPAATCWLHLASLKAGLNSYNGSFLHIHADLNPRIKAVKNTDNTKRGRWPGRHTIRSFGSHSDQWLQWVGHGPL